MSLRGDAYAELPKGDAKAEEEVKVEEVNEDRGELEGSEGVTN